MDSKRRVADTTGKRCVHTTIMSTSFLRKADEREKDKRTHDQRPAEYLEANSPFWIILPNKAWDLKNLGIVAVRVGPAYPRRDTDFRIVHDKKCPQWNGSEYLDDANGHQAEVLVKAETLGKRH